MIPASTAPTRRDYLVGVAAQGIETAYENAHFGSMEMAEFVIDALLEAGHLDMGDA